MKPLFVDLDGTLLFNDSVQEVFWRLVFTKPWHAIIAVYILLSKGRAPFKDYIAKHVKLSGIQWPINPDVLKLLNAEKSRGRKIILLTASNEKIAKAIAAPLEIFDKIVGSTSSRNFKGGEKLSWINSNFHAEPFMYAGNSTDDFILWGRAAEAIVVNPSSYIYEHAQKICKKVRLIQNLPQHFKTWAKLLRVHQYSKNLLLFVPLLLSGQLWHWHLFSTCLLAWVCFSATASAAYIINDLVDLDSDRAHSTKKNRPLAAGLLNISEAALWVLGLFVVTILGCLHLPFLFSVTLAGYFALTLAYSFYIKRVAILDVFVLSFLYLSRLLAGSVATMVVFSNWLIAFTLFFFLSLAYLKRFIEIERTTQNAKIKGRGYFKKDRELVKTSGLSLGFLSVVIFSLYLNANISETIYKHPNGLWCIAPALLYWINHLWHCAVHNKIHDDPIEFALKDKLSLCLGGFIFIIIMLCQR